MFIIWVKFVEIPKQIFGSQLIAINRSLISDKARCFSQSDRALYGNFIIKQYYFVPMFTFRFPDVVEKGFARFFYKNILLEEEIDVTSNCKKI